MTTAVPVALPVEGPPYPAGIAAANGCPTLACVGAAKVLSFINIYILEIDKGDIVTDARQKQRTASTTIARIAVWVVAVIAVIHNAVQVYTIVSGHVLIAFGGADSRLPLTSLAQINQAELRGGGTGYLVDVPAWLRVLCSVPAFLNILVAVLAAILVVRIIRRIAVGQPFVPAVRRNWVALSAVLIVGGVLLGIADAVAGQVVFGVASNFTFQPPFPLGADYQVLSVDVPRWPFFMILTGVVGLAISAAFKEGARLEEEADGLV